MTPIAPVPPPAICLTTWFLPLMLLTSTSAFNVAYQSATKTTNVLKNEVQGQKYLCGFWDTDKEHGGGSTKNFERDQSHDSPSPPMIASPQITDDEDPGQRRQGVVTSALVDSEDDVDVDTELRKATGAAVVHHSASLIGMKEEDIELGEQVHVYYIGGQQNL
ncbi:hypothetical protein BD769DRAFT_1394520 [Suillus cothurnatus]|nr:hypothetical protein BD769DRAFT_1394520 [Suillus cothurnatus]